MYNTDLWLALLDKDNPRSHPLLAALLYAFCPAAARWWLAGADVALLPFDPVWQALKDLSGGETLKAALTRYGFEDILDEAKRYVDEVDAYRRTHPGIDSPETLPTFPGGRMSLDRRFGLSDAIAKMGKDWSNFFAYIRAWAFLYPDWEARIQFFATPEFNPVRLALTLPGIRRPVYLPAWLWTLKKGYAVRMVIGLPVEDEQDEIRFSLAACSPEYLPARSSVEADTGKAAESKPWLAPGGAFVVPEVWALKCSDGIAEPRDPHVEDEHLLPLVNALADAAEKGPYPPLNALRSPSACRKCVYIQLCYQEHHLAPLALSAAPFNNPSTSLKGALRASAAEHA